MPSLNPTDERHGAERSSFVVVRSSLAHAWAKTPTELTAAFKASVASALNETGVVEQPLLKEAFGNR